MGMCQQRRVDVRRALRFAQHRDEVDRVHQITRIRDGQRRQVLERLPGRAFDDLAAQTSDGLTTDRPVVRMASSNRARTGASASASVWAATPAVAPMASAAPEKGGKSCKPSLFGAVTGLGC